MDDNSGDPNDGFVIHNHVGCNDPNCHFLNYDDDIDFDAELPTFQRIEDLPSLPAMSPEEWELHPRNPMSRDPDLRDAVNTCKSGDVAAAAQCVQRYVQAGKAPEPLTLCLEPAVESSNKDMVQMLLATGMEIGQPEIKIAIRNTDLGVLSVFLDYGWDINKQQAWIHPPYLSMALVINPNPTLISWFLDNGADPIRPCTWGTTPLGTAVQCAPLAIVEQVFDHCPNASTCLEPLLHLAAERTDDDSTAIMQLVLDRCRPDINAIMWEQLPFPFVTRKTLGLGTALHSAVSKGLPSAVEMLLQAGIDVSIRDTRGRTALEVARESGKDAVAEILVQAEARQAKLQGPRI